MYIYICYILRLTGILDPGIAGMSVAYEVFLDIYIDAVEHGLLHGDALPCTLMPVVWWDTERFQRGVSGTTRRTHTVAHQK